MRKVISMVPLLVFAAVLTACGILDHYEDRARNMNRSIDASRNEMLLLNVARARYGHPLTFISMTNVSASQNSGGSLGLPTLTLGNGQTEPQRQFVFGGNSVNAGGNSNVSVVPLESKEFYQGLLQPLSLSVAQFFVSQGYPRQILFYLFIDSVRVRGPLKDTIFYNDPADATFGEFQKFVEQAALSGLTIELDGTGKDAHPRLCFDSGIASQPLLGHSPICGRKANNQAKLTGLLALQFASQPMQLNMRSTYGIFRYLGKLTIPELGDRVRVVSSHLAGLSVSEDNRLFPIEHGAVFKDCLASISYQGDLLCVPGAGNEQGAQILQLLAQLIGLNVSLRDLPIVQSVRVSN